MSTVFFLVKFFSNPNYATDFVRGKIFANTLSTFKTIECSDDTGRADRHEGTVTWLQPGQARLQLNGMDMSNNLAGPLQVQKDWLNHLHVFCLHAVHSGRLDLTSLSSDNLEDLRREFTIPQACSSFGEHAVVVNDVPEFIRRMKAAARAKKYALKYGLVRYYDSELFHGSFGDLESIFWKQDHFSYQREFRFAITTGLMYDRPLRLQIGDLRDITLSLNSAELSGERFLGGQMALPA